MLRSERPRMLCRSPLLSNSSATKLADVPRGRDILGALSPLTAGRGDTTDLPASVFGSQQ